MVLNSNKNRNKTNKLWTSEQCAFELWHYCIQLLQGHSYLCKFSLNCFGTAYICFQCGTSFTYAWHCAITLPYILG